MATQIDLFSATGAEAEPPIAGLLLVAEAVAAEQEAALAAHVDAAPLAPFAFGPWHGKRLTCSYGQGYDFTRGRPVEAPPLPGWLLALREMLAPLAGIAPAELVQALLIRYDPGAGIGWHRDRPHYGAVLGLSLTSPATLRLRRRGPGGRFERRNIALPPRSLYRLDGAARDEWQHSIAPMATVRRSITLRTLR